MSELKMLAARVARLMQQNPHNGDRDTPECWEFMFNTAGLDHGDVLILGCLTDEQLNDFACGADVFAKDSPWQEAHEFYAWLNSVFPGFNAHDIANKLDLAMVEWVEFHT